MKYRLIELLKTSGMSEEFTTVEEVSDHLITNGVVVVDTDIVSPKNRPLISQCLGKPIDEVIDLIRAKDEGRIVELPVKVGQTVWFIRDKYHNKIEETNVEKVIVKNGGIYIKLGCNSMYETSCNSIGKTVFLTREEAEKALAESEGKE